MATDGPYADPVDANPDADGTCSRAAGQTPQAATATPVRARSHIPIDGGDVLLDVPRLAVEEIALEVSGSVGIEQVSLTARGLEVDLLLKADLAELRSLIGGGSRRRKPDIEGAAREAGTRSGQDGEAGDDGGGDGGRPAPVERLEAVGRRAFDAARHGGKAAGVAAGVAAVGAGGALLESRLGSQRGRRPSLPLPSRHRGPGQRLVKELQRRLPD